MYVDIQLLNIYLNNAMIRIGVFVATLVGGRERSTWDYVR